MNQTHQMKPIAAGLASLGRNGDSMLVHMQPHEVAGLQQLAMAHGGSLTINPHTGLPEASFLGGVFKALAPIALGFALGPGGIAGAEGLFGMGSLGAGLATGALGWALSGNPLTGLSAGLGAYGGANLRSAIQNAVPNVATVSRIGETAASELPTATAAAAPEVGSSEFWNSTKSIPFGEETGSIAVPKSSLASPLESEWGISRTAAQPSLAGGLEAIKADPMAFIKNNPGAAFTAASPLLAGAMAPQQFKTPSQKPDPSEKYEGPYIPSPRQARFPTPEEQKQLGTREYQYFNDVNPYPGYLTAAQYNAQPYAEGGDVTETPDPGSDPAENESGKYGAPMLNKAAGGIATFADGGSTYTDYNSIPSVAFQEQLDARNKQIDDLMGKGSGRGVYGQPDQGIYGLFGGMFRPSLTRAQAEAKVGPAPVWDPSSMYQNQPQVAPTYAQADPNFSGMGITSLPTQEPSQNLNLTRGFSDMSRDIINSGMRGMAKGGYLDGPGDGMSDSIPATIANKQPARLADGEFVVPADVVSHLGNGSTKAGAQRLYSMMDKVRKARTGTTKQGKQINPNKYMPA
jgi:hypothetical protein